MSDVLLEVKNLNKQFKVGKKQILKAVDDVSFTIKKGETLGLVGESGCGKTTVGRTLLRIYDHDNGEIIFDGEDISNISKKRSRELTKDMQMIYQDPYASLNPFYTVEDIIGEGLDNHKICKTKEERREKIIELLNVVGLHKDHINRFPHEFSGGQRQRIGIARALAVNPKFIVCDEATSALDVSIQAQVMNMLISLQKEYGLTFLFIAHDLSMVRYVSDNICVMYMGKVVEYGKTNDVYNNPKHPYTKGLLSAVPVANPDYRKIHKLELLSGEVTSPINPSDGCRFASRCPNVMDICKKEDPKLKEFGNDHKIYCHL